MPKNRTRRRHVIREPGLEIVDSRPVWTLGVEESVRPGVSVVVEFASVDGGRPVVRQVTVTNDFLVPDRDIDTRDLRTINLDILRADATESIATFLRDKPEWAAGVKFGPDGKVPRKRGRPPLDERLLALVARAYVEAVHSLQSADRGRSTDTTWEEKSVYRLMAKRLVADHGVHRSPDRLRKYIAKAREGGLLTPATGTRVGGELTTRCVALLREVDANAVGGRNR
jgi:hypothetical protein